MAEPAPARTTPVADPQLVNITAGKTKDDVPTVDLHPARISEKGQVRWHLKGDEGKSFRVLFVGPQGTPFGSQYEFSGGEDGDAVTPAATVAGSNTQYEYVVSVDGGRPLDPVLIVDP